MDIADCYHSIWFRRRTLGISLPCMKHKLDKGQEVVGAPIQEVLASVRRQKEFWNSELSRNIQEDHKFGYNFLHGM